MKRCINYNNRLFRAQSKQSPIEDAPQEKRRQQVEQRQPHPASPAAVQGRPLRSRSQRGRLLRRCPPPSDPLRRRRPHDDPDRGTSDAAGAQEGNDRGNGGNGDGGVEGGSHHRGGLGDHPAEQPEGQGGGRHEAEASTA